MCNDILMLINFDYWDWLTIVYWDVSMFSHYATEFLAEICESYEYLYVMYMNIMQA